jgi:ribosomal protein S27AE
MIKLEPCNRCCSDSGVLTHDNKVQCGHCGFTEDLEVWQIRGWRNIVKYPPVYSGVIFVYGKEIGRTIARWDAKTQSCDNPLVTHWLRTPDPTKQIGMEGMD